MQIEEFNYIWDKIVYGAVINVYDELKKRDFVSQHNIALRSLGVDGQFHNDVYEGYSKARKELKSKYFFLPDGKIDDSLMDCHKIAACMCRSLIENKAFSFDFDPCKAIPGFVSTCNYNVAWLVSVGIVKMFLLRSLKRQLDHGVAEDRDANYRRYVLLREATPLFFPPVNRGHDSYDVCIIKMLALNDWYQNGFDMLSYANIMFCIESYNMSEITRVSAESKIQELEAHSKDKAKQSGDPETLYNSEE